MPKDLILDNGRLVNATDFEAKANEIITSLQNTLFKDINEETATVHISTGWGEKSYKKSFTKGEILPFLNTSQVNAKLNELLRIYKPMSLVDAKTLQDDEYLDAFRYYMTIITFINKYIVFQPSKQTFCAFANITTSIYNDLIGDISYSQVFGSIEDYFIDSNFTSAQAGLIDSRTTLQKLQTKDAGHNLVKNPESLTVTQNYILDKQEVNKKCLQFEEMIKGTKKK